MKLYSHQIAGIDFALKARGNCALFWDPGCGKTLAALQIFKKFRESNPALKLLVICPLSLINAAWGADISQFTSFLWSPWRKLKDNSDIVLINYEALISQRNYVKIIEMINRDSFMCVLDESSKIKNHKSQTTKKILAMSPYFPYKIIASGTPMPNSEMELWGQIRFIHPEAIHRSFYAFRNIYFHLGRGKQIFDFHGQTFNKMVLMEMFRKGWNYNITPQKRELLMNKISAFTHWIKKEDALDLPDKIIQIRDIILSHEERKIYNEMKNELITEIKGHQIAAPVALAKVTKLRQATSGFMYDSYKKAIPIRKKPSKFIELCNLLEEFGKRQVIIWCQFHYEIEFIGNYLGNKATSLYSKTKNKDESICAFKNGTVQYLLAHPRSAGHGLTFVNCDTMIFYSMDFSYETHIQAKDRIHRIGQNKKCLYIYLKAINTIDENLINIIQKKQRIQDLVYEIVGNYVEREGSTLDQELLSEDICI